MGSRRTLISRSLRQSLHHTEVRVWACLRQRQVDGWKFRRQHPIGPYFVDFCCPAASLVLEVVGPAHDDDPQWSYDQQRYAWLEAHGYRVVRIRVQDVDADLDEAIVRHRPGPDDDPALATERRDEPLAAGQVAEGAPFGQRAVELQRVGAEPAAPREMIRAT